MFIKAKKIWIAAEAAPDTYGDFAADFEYTNGSAVLRICADSNYAAYVNGNLVGFGQYNTYPNRTVADEIDITAFVRKGVNRLAVVVWYFGKGCFTYAPGSAGVTFEVEADGTVLAASDENTLSRPDPGYKAGRCVNITPQLGLDFFRDETSADDSFIIGNLSGFARSYVVCDCVSSEPRPVERLVLGSRLPSKICRTGVFSYGEDWENRNASENMHYAAVSFREVQVMTDKTRDYVMKSDQPVRISADGNIFVLLDLSRETVGFLDLDIEVPEDCRIDIGWGEHIRDGLCRTSMHLSPRSFGVTVMAKAGRNRYINPFRRLGCRYVQLFIHSDKATLHYAGIRPTDYPVEVKSFRSGNLLRDTVYKICVETLHLCMHEHYEDCPWREQALYALDSRNQMLCGYYAFGEYKFPRASLKLLADSLRPDGHLNITAPCEAPLTIPSFSLAYFIALDEYTRYSSDITLADEVYPTLERILTTFAGYKRNDGLLVSPVSGKTYWNFYEWSPTLDGSPLGGNVGVEAPLNMYYSMALSHMADICRALGKFKRSEELLSEKEEVNAAIRSFFFNSQCGLFSTSSETDRYSVLVNAMAVLCGAADGLDTSRICETLTLDTKSAAAAGLVPSTLSMNAFRFDALLKLDREKYAPTILDEIDRIYLEMLREGATSFWETELGEAAFADAGSLCHGWAALPVYYYSILM